VLAVAEGRPVFPERSEAPIVGRRDELARLRRLFAAVAAERCCRVLTVFGEAGIGKTRLARELVAAVAHEATVLVGRCVSYGEGATYLPLRDAFRGVDAAAALAGSEEAELVGRRVAELTGQAEGGSTSGEGFWAVRRLLEALAGERPLLLVLEDVHWAEPTFLDLVEYLAQWSAEAPIPVLCLARPELIDARPAWGGPASPIGSLALEPLSAADSQRLVAALAGHLAPEARASIAETAEGNPLYAEQLAAYAQDAGAEALADVPATIDALLASRLDRLETGERAALERAAVVGREFSHGDVLHLSPPEEAGSLGRHLLSLARRGLVQPGPSSAPSADAYRFHHVLVRDVAYAAIPKEARAGLHERFADRLEQQHDDDALVGYHLEQAYRLRADLGERDGHASRVAVAAGERLSAAGVRAWHVGDAPAATNLLGRAAELLPASHHSRAETLRELGNALWAVGEGEQVDAVLLDAIETAAASADRRSELKARLDLAYRRLFSDPEGRAEELLDLAREAIPVFETLGDNRALGWAWLAVAHVHGGWQGRYGAAASDLERALAHYRAGGWVPSMCVRELAMALYFGPTPADVAIDRCAGLLDEAGRLGRADVGIYAAGVEAMRGRLPQARRLAGETRETYEELARISLWTTWAPVAAEIERLGGDRPAAARILEDACGSLERLGEPGLVSERAAFLSAVLCQEGRFGDAEPWASLAERTAASDDEGAQMRWRAARARLLAHRGALSEAETLVRGALRIAQESDRLNAHGDVLVDLAQILRHDGRDAAATASLEAARALYGRKGNLVSAQHTEALLRALAPA
jgi:tetratricopeptide (TPR) repeat protein